MFLSHQIPRVFRSSCSLIPIDAQLPNLAVDESMDPNKRQPSTSKKGKTSVSTYHEEIRGICNEICVIISVIHIYTKQIKQIKQIKQQLIITIVIIIDILHMSPRHFPDIPMAARNTLGTVKDGATHRILGRFLRTKVTNPAAEIAPMWCDHVCWLVNPMNHGNSKRGVSKTWLPKNGWWMENHGKSWKIHLWFGGTPILGNLHMVISCYIPS